MTVAISKSQKIVEKRKIKRLLREYGIELMEVAEKSAEFRGNGMAYHRNTVSDALDVEDKYWNQDIVNAAVALIEEKRQSANQ